MAPPSSISTELHVSSIMYFSIKNDLNIYSMQDCYEVRENKNWLEYWLAEKFFEQLEFTPLVLYYLL